MLCSLIIEDDPDASDLLAALLRDRKQDPIQALTGEQGLEQARQRKPSVIFLDLMLPDLDGYKICETLKLDRETNKIPIIMVTALSAPQNRLRGFRVGADAYVSKPYSPDDIDRALDKAFLRQQRLIESKVEHYIEIDLSSETGTLHSVNELFGIILNHTKFSEREVFQLRTALQEMGSNAIEWGNRHDATKLVRINCHVCVDRVEIQIADEGEGFDAARLAHAYDGGEDPTKHFLVREMLGLREGGFGILMAKGLVDEVKYNDRGNHVTLIKHFTQ